MNRPLQGLKAWAWSLHFALIFSPGPGRGAPPRRPREGPLSARLLQARDYDFRWRTFARSRPAPSAECADEERKLWEHLRAKRFAGFNAEVNTRDSSMCSKRFMQRRRFPDPRASAGALTKDPLWGAAAAPFSPGPGAKITATTQTPRRRLGARATKPDARSQYFGTISRLNSSIRVGALSLSMQKADFIESGGLLSLNLLDDLLARSGQAGRFESPRESETALRWGSHTSCALDAPLYGFERRAH